jgi:hypothetical protein
MAVPLKDVLDALPPKRRAGIDRRFKELVNEVTLKISQPAVSKIEKQTDMYLSTLRSYVEAVGGELDVIVRLPNRRPVRVRSLEEIDAA